jgi:LmbE family N-acetylglucosaminyl deacetylase
MAVAWCGWAPSLRLDARPETAPQAVTDRMTYNAGERILLRIIFPSPPGEPTPVRYLFTIRYEGETKPVAEGSVPGGAGDNIRGYRVLWNSPLDARAGRYEIDLRAQNPTSPHAIHEFPGIGSFVIHRQAIRIVSAEVAEPYFTSGDVIGCSVKIENLSGRPLSGLSLEFSERYWPWIAQQREGIGTNIQKLQNEITLPPRQQITLRAPHCAVAPSVDQPRIKQYAAVVWDRGRKNVLAIAFTPLVFINPPGVTAPHPYPPQYIYPSLDEVDTSSYRHFLSPPLGAGAIQFDTRHTQFPSGAEATVKFTLANPTDAAWLEATVRARLLGPDGNEQGKQVVAEHVDLLPQGSKLTQAAKFALPPGVSGLFHAVVEITGASGQTLSTNILELGVNPLPKSVLVFAAHEDDDGTQMGFIRSLVENQVPLHMVYYTSGDAGGCDRYFQHSCGPAEALNYGAVRMQETRAAMGHLGVPPENILFLGLPDGGTGKIWYEHPKSTDPYLAVLLASDHAPYEGLFRPNLAFARDAVVEATEEIIRKLQPEVIFTVHPPAEGHIDHIVNNFFVIKALQELLRAGTISPDLEVRVDRIFDPKEHPATPYRYEDHQIYVSGEAAALGQEAGWFYQSQDGNHEEGKLRTWDQLPRAEGYRKVLDWKEHEGWNEKE